MTTAEMRSLLLKRFNDPGEALFDRVTIQQLLNQSYRKIYNYLIANKIYTNKKITTVTFTADTQEVDFTSDLTGSNQFERILYVLNEDGIRVPIYEEEFSKESEIPSCYLKRSIDNALGNENATINNKLGWYRTPSSSFILTVYYISIFEHFETVGITSEIGHEIPISHHDVVVDCATYLGWAMRGVRDDSATTVAFWKNEYQEGLQLMLASLGPQGETQQSVVDMYAED